MTLAYVTIPLGVAIIGALAVGFAGGVGFGFLLARDHGQPETPAALHLAPPELEPYLPNSGARNDGPVPAGATQFFCFRHGTTVHADYCLGCKMESEAHGQPFPGYRRTLPPIPAADGSIPVEGVR